MRYSVRCEFTVRDGGESLTQEKTITVDTSGDDHDARLAAEQALGEGWEAVEVEELDA